jgi:hypothetical protein
MRRSPAWTVALFLLLPVPVVFRTIMNAKIACLDCGFPYVLTCPCCIQDDHEREDRLPGLWISFCSYLCPFYSRRSWMQRSPVWAVAILLPFLVLLRPIMDTFMQRSPAWTVAILLFLLFPVIFRTIMNAKIACLDFSLQKVKMKMGVQLLVSDVDQLDKMRYEYQHTYVKKMGAFS